MCSVFLTYCITVRHCPYIFMFTFNSYLLFNVVQTQVPSFEIIELLLGKMSLGGGGTCSHQTKTPIQWKGTMGLQKPTRWHLSTLPSSQAHMRTHSAYGNKVGRVQAPFASHISCMTAFHHRGQPDQEVRSYLCEFLTAKYCRNGTTYFGLSYDTMAQNSCFGSVDLYYVEIFNTCLSRPH